ncbi:WXG100 family type VII secretion target [Nocardia sp. NBC_00508]|uniref:WXG100 family type VII secretion target n=1 Tax=Nocardia sp. NBC_00508 TaxID=2975992 RepID=UPI002E824AFF|nr:WXG100 family type VII secretion target [Nocardia sp. NBC_00508]WUD64352.1 WXG100 family type VII secretion target [Nocardia sp. NBC_00508]
MTETAGAGSDFAMVPAEVSDAGRYVQQAANQLISGLRSADAEVAGLMATWRGPAATAYQAAWDEARRGAVQILEALDGMGDLLGVAVDTVVAVDTGRAEATSSLDLP